MAQFRFASVAALLALALTSTLMGCGDDPIVDKAATADTSSNDVVDQDLAISDGAGDVVAVLDVADAAAPVDVAGDAVAPADALGCPGGPGCACENDVECGKGQCLWSTTAGRSCAWPCEANTDCSDGRVCAESAGEKVCVDAQAAICSPCETNVACQVPGANDAACVDRGAAGNYCGVQCAADTDCRDGYSCTAAKDVEGNEVKQCLPTNDAACTCSAKAKAEQATTTCFTSKGGLCVGNRTCLEKDDPGAPDGGGLTACDAPGPSTETCDGLDEDCDGTADQGDLCDDDNACTTDACTGGKCVPASPVNYS